MALRLLKFLSFAYWQFRALARAIRDDGYDGFKAGALLCILEGMIVSAVVCSISLILRRNLLRALGGSAGLYVVAVGLGTAALNYYFLDYRKTWTEFESEFRTYSTRARILGRVGVFFTVLLIIIGTFVLLGLTSRLPS